MLRDGYQPEIDCSVQNQFGERPDSFNVGSRKMGGPPNSTETTVYFDFKLYTSSIQDSYLRHMESPAHNLSSDITIAELKKRERPKTKYEFMPKVEVVSDIDQVITTASKNGPMVAAFGVTAEPSFSERRNQYRQSI